MSEEIKKIIFTNIGAASMCWSETPKGEFESTRAIKLGDEIYNKFKELEDSNNVLKKFIGDLPIKDVDHLTVGEHHD